MDCSTKNTTGDGGRVLEKESPPRTGVAQEASTSLVTMEAGVLDRPAENAGDCPEPSLSLACPRSVKERLARALSRSSSRTREEDWGSAQSVGPDGELGSGTSDGGVSARSVSSERRFAKKDGRGRKPLNPEDEGLFTAEALAYKKRTREENAVALAEVIADSSVKASSQRAVRAEAEEQALLARLEERQTGEISSMTLLAIDGIKKGMDRSKNIKGPIRGVMWDAIVKMTACSLTLAKRANNICGQEGLEEARKKQAELVAEVGRLRDEQALLRQQNDRLREGLREGLREDRTSGPPVPAEPSAGVSPPGCPARGASSEEGGKRKRGTGVGGKNISASASASSSNSSPDQKRKRRGGRRGAVTRIRSSSSSSSSRERMEWVGSENQPSTQKLGRKESLPVLQLTQEQKELGERCRAEVVRDEEGGTLPPILVPPLRARTVARNSGKVVVPRPLPVEKKSGSIPREQAGGEEPKPQRQPRRRGQAREDWPSLPSGGGTKGGPRPAAECHPSIGPGWRPEDLGAFVRDVVLQVLEATGLIAGPGASGVRPTKGQGGPAVGAGRGGVEGRQRPPRTSVASSSAPLTTPAGGDRLGGGSGGGGRGKKGAGKGGAPQGGRPPVPVRTEGSKGAAQSAPKTLPAAGSE